MGISREELFAKIASTSDEYFVIDCLSAGQIPFISRGPRYNVEIHRNQLVSMVTMGYEIVIKDQGAPSEPLVVEPSITKEEIAEIIDDIVDAEAKVQIETIIEEPVISEEVIAEPEVVTEVLEVKSYTKDDLKGKTKVELQNILKEMSVEFKYHDNTDVLSNRILNAK